jgi:PKD repeat protein
MADRISTLDIGYTTGNLSVFPEALDNKETLYEVKNNAITKLKQGISFLSKIIVVEDTTGFPDKGLIRLGSFEGNLGTYELVYYNKKTSNTFQDLKRGFANSRQNAFKSGSTVANAVMAEPHNAVKDAILNMEVNFGLRDAPDPASLNGILKAQEIRFLSAKPLFRAFPIKGPPPLVVRFQNFSGGNIVRFLWDFGDGSTSLDESPLHEYQTEGVFSVKLNVITATGAQGVANKTDYITVSTEEFEPFFYASPMTGLSATTSFLFVDQTDGDIVQRNWIFGDNEITTENDPDVHTAQHVYANPGEYTVVLLDIFSNGRLKKVELPDKLVVL